MVDKNFTSRSFTLPNIHYPFWNRIVKTEIWIFKTISDKDEHYSCSARRDLKLYSWQILNLRLSRVSNTQYKTQKSDTKRITYFGKIDVMLRWDGKEGTREVRDRTPHVLEENTTVLMSNEGGLAVDS